MVITSSGGKNKKWTIAIIATFLLLSLAAGVLYFISRKIDLQKEEVSQEPQTASYAYVMNEDGTVDNERVAINMTSTGEIRKMLLKDKVSEKEIGEVYILKGYVYGASGKKGNLEIVVQAIHSETGEILYDASLNAIIQAGQLDISMLDVLSVSQLEKIFPSGSNWEIKTSIVGADEAEPGVVSIFLDFINALGGKDYYLSILQYVNSDLKGDFENIIMPEAIIPVE